MVVTISSAVPPPSLTTQLETIAFLCGVYSEIEAAKNLLFVNVIDRPTSLSEIHAILEASSKQYAQRKRINYSLPNIDTLPERWQYFEDKLKKQPRFRCCFGSTEYHLRRVPIQSLITPQWYVNLSHVEELKQRTPEPDSNDLEEVLQFAFPSEQPLPKPQQNIAGLLFPPNLQNLHTTLTPIQRGTAQEYTSNLHVHTIPNYLQVAKVDQRLIVVNGIHRICALWLRGWKRIPCLFREANSLSELGFNPGQLGHPPQQEILGSKFPPYVLDLLDENLTMTFHQHCNIHTQISVQRMNVASGA